MKYILIFFFSVSFFFMTEYAQAQSSRDSESSNKSKSSSSKKKKKKGKAAYELQYEQGIKDYEALMAANKKKYHKMQKGMQKPQYSDPTYFGHKRPPKKRKKGKRKFCKECGIIH